MNVSHAHDYSVSADTAPIGDTLEDVARTAVGTASGNDRLFDMAPGLFRALERQRPGRDAVGINWVRQMPPGVGYCLASVHRKLTAIDGIASLLRADFETQMEGDESEQLPVTLRESLMMALTELVSSARDAMCTVGEDFGDADYKARGAQDGGT